MNERIDELAQQAGCYITSRYDPLLPAGNGWIINQETLDKFAELIVRECAKIAWQDSSRYAIFYNDTIMTGKADVLALCSQHIKEHFGVEV